MTSHVRMLAATASSLAAFLSGAPAYAHHSYAMFDSTKTMTVTGTVKQFQFTNPHSWIQVMAPAPNGGALTEWSVQMGAPFELVRAGMGPQTLKPGDKIVLQIHPAKDGGAAGSFLSAADGDGHPIGKAAK
jgi:hypothetical protein